jgi:hypothetical protein
LDHEFAGSLTKTYPRIAQYVAQHYHEVGCFDFNEDKSYIVLAENGRMPVRSFGDLPCFASPEPSQLSRRQ